MHGFCQMHKPRREPQFPTPKVELTASVLLGVYVTIL